MRIQDDPAWSPAWPSMQDLCATAQSGQSEMSLPVEPMMAVAGRVMEDPSDRKVMTALQAELERGPAAAAGSVLGIAGLAATCKPFDFESIIGEGFLEEAPDTSAFDQLGMLARAVWPKLVKQGLYDDLARFYLASESVRRTFRGQSLMLPRPRRRPRAAT